MRHAPSSWRVTKERGNVQIIADEGANSLTIATVHKVGAGDPDANASLIAAAPELLSIAEECLFSLEAAGIDSGLGNGSLASRLRDIVDKAQRFRELDGPIVIDVI